jgi:hypothetical protein
MAGQIKRMLDHIVTERGKGNDALAMITKAKLILKGLDPGRFTTATPDDPATIARIRQIARDLGVTL